MEQAHSVEHYQVFYNKFAPSIFGYCRLFLGDVKSAEEATTESFSNYFERLKGGWTSGRFPLTWLPMALLIQAVRACRFRRTPTAAPSMDRAPFDLALSSLSPSAREVFIIHGLLRLRLPEAAAVTGLFISSAEHLWIASLFHFRKMWLKKDELAELTEQCLSNIRELLLRRGRSS